MHEKEIPAANPIPPQEAGFEPASFGIYESRALPLSYSRMKPDGRSRADLNPVLLHLTHVLCPQSQFSNDIVTVTLKPFFQVTFNDMFPNLLC